VSARPSDAVALALRVGAPILVNDDLMAAEGKIMELDLDDDDDDDDDDDEPANEADLVAELREFLDTIRPEDFGQ
jgi:bifunctional DNase/RNase